MDNEPLLLGVDVGTTSCKAALFDLHGGLHGYGRLPTPTYYPQPNWAEHDPEDLWQAVATVIRQAVSSVDPARVGGVAIASVGEAGVLLDSSGNPTYPIIAWYDSRTVEQYRWWLEKVGTPLTFSITGLTPDPIFSAYKLMWLRDQAPDAYAKAETWLNVADYIAFRLCGSQATDYSMASRTMMLDLTKLSWSDALIERAGIRRDLLPELVESGTQLGAATERAAEETGLTSGTPVGSGGHDHVCGAFAVGVYKPGTCLDSMGTAEPVFMPIEEPRLDEQDPYTGGVLGAHVVRNRYYAMGVLSTSGRAVEWAAKRLDLPGRERNLYERIETAATSAPPGSLGTFFLPRLAGGNRGAFIGLSDGAGVEAMARAVYEGLAYEWRKSLEAMESALDRRAESIRLIGGGTRSSLLVQIKANVVGRPLRVICEGNDSVALGAALLAGIAADLYTSERDAVTRMSHTERIIDPDPSRTAFYNDCYHEIYLRIAPALADVHKSIGQILHEH